MEKKEKLALFLAVVMTLILISFGVYSLMEFKTIQGKVIYSEIKTYPYQQEQDPLRLYLVRIKDDGGRKYDVAGWFKTRKLKEGQIVEVTFARFETVLSMYIGGRHYDGVVVYGIEEKLPDGTILGTYEHVRFKRIVSYRILKNVP